MCKTTFPPAWRRSAVALSVIASVPLLAASPAAASGHRGFLPLSASPFTGIELLAMLPIGAAAVVFFRAVGGVRTFGLFVPVLLAIAFIQTGFLTGPLIFGSVVAAGLLTAPFLRRLHLPRVGLVAAFMSVVALALIAIHEFAGFEAAGFATAFPVIVTAVVIERLWHMWEENGVQNALQTAFWTFLTASLIQLGMLSPPVRWMLDVSPFLLAATGLVLVLWIGRYRGLRLNELFRFRTVLETERAR